MTQRSPIVTPLVTTTLAPHQTLSPTRVGPLGREALPGDRPVAVVEAVVAVGDEAAVGEHAVRADLDELDAGHHHAEVQEGALADAHAGVARRGDPDPGLEQRPGAHLQAPLEQRLEHVAVDRPAHERLAARPSPSGCARGSTGSVLRSYQRHFCSHSLACAAVIGRGESQVHRGLQVHGTPRRDGSTRRAAVVGNVACFRSLLAAMAAGALVPATPRPPSTRLPPARRSGASPRQQPADERGGRRQRPLPRGARRRRHEPDHPRARAGADPAGQPGPSSPGTATAPAASGGGGYRVAARRLAERHRRAPGRRRWAALAAANGLRLDSWVIPGTTLRLPAPGSAPAPRPPRPPARARPRRWAPTRCARATRSAAWPPPRACPWLRWPT